jgi:hypothetical protein
MIVKKKPVRLVSPLVLFTLAGCSPEDYASIGIFNSLTDANAVSVDGNVIKGPLSNSIVFLDYNRNGQLDPGAGEPSLRTGTDGRYKLSTVNKNFNIVAKTDESTVDTSSGVILSGITLIAPGGATVITPLTTLMVEGNLTANQVTEVLGLPSDVNVLSFNPFSSAEGSIAALAVEKISHQLMSAVNAFAASAEGAGANEADAFEAALQSVVKVIAAKVAKVTDPTASASDTKLDLTSTADLSLIKAQVMADVATVAGVNTTAFAAVADETATAVKNVSDKIATLTDLTSDSSKNTFSITQVLADQVQSAATAETNSAGTGTIAFTSVSAVDTAATNQAPTDITLTSSSISETASTLAIGTLGTVDDSASGFIYSVAKLAGSDFADFSVNAETSELSFIAAPDYETKSAYSVTIISTDPGGKSYSKSFNIAVLDVNEAPSITSGAITSATEDVLYSYRFVAQDADAGDTVTYAAPTLPPWLSFDTSTAILSGTPTNSHVGTYAVILTVTDMSGVVGTQSFTLTVGNVNDAPTITSTPVTSTAEDSAYSYTFVASDDDAGDTVTYAASTLPSWLGFKTSSGVLSGTPDDSDVGTHSVALTATDGTGRVDSQNFSITVGAVNDTPTVSTPITDQTVIAGLPLSFQIASTTFADVETGESLIYTATLSDGGTLPSWLGFDASTLAFSGTPALEDAGILAVRVTATDSGSSAVSDTFNLNVSAEGPLSFGNMLASVFTTTAFPMTQFETSFQLSTVNTKYTYDAATTTYAAPYVSFKNGAVTATETLRVWIGDTSAVSIITHLYTEQGSAERIGWTSGYDNTDQGIGFEMTDSTSLSGTAQSSGSWVASLAASSDRGLDLSWFNASVINYLGTTASYVDNYEIGAWVEDADRDGTYEQKGSLLKFFSGTRDIDGGGTSLGAAYHDDLSGLTMLYSPAVASEGTTFDLGSYSIIM